MLQYGPLFHGPAGVCIPIGLPLLVVIGYLLRKDVPRSDSTEECDDASCAALLAASGRSDANADD